jgi:hypothetical protein
MSTLYAAGVFRSTDNEADTFTTGLLGLERDAAGEYVDPAGQHGIKASGYGLHEAKDTEVFGEYFCSFNSADVEHYLAGVASLSRILATPPLLYAVVVWVDGTNRVVLSVPTKLWPYGTEWCDESRKINVPQVGVYRCDSTGQILRRLETTDEVVFPDTGTYYLFVAESMVVAEALVAMGLVGKEAGELGAREREKQRLLPGAN